MLPSLRGSDRVGRNPSMGSHPWLKAGIAPRFGNPDVLRPGLVSRRSPLGTRFSPLHSQTRG